MAKQIGIIIQDVQYDAEKKEYSHEAEGRSKVHVFDVAEGAEIDKDKILDTFVDHVVKKYMDETGTNDARVIVLANGIRIMEADGQYVAYSISEIEE